jgi:hypothetical protein
MFARIQFEMGSARASRAASNALVVGFAVRANETNESSLAKSSLAARSVRREGASNRSRGGYAPQKSDSLLAHEEKANA